MTHLKVESFRLADLQTYHRNPRRGDVDAIAESLKARGQYRPIVVNIGTHASHDYEILAGNHTYMAAKKLGWKTIQATTVDVDDDQAAQIVLADNRLADLGGYDDQTLSDLLQDVSSLDGLGWDRDDADALAAALDPDPNDDTDIEDVGTPVDAPTRVHPGEIWLLGDHRLMCGDSTDRASVARLMHGNTADVCFTSPPYNLGRSAFGGNVQQDMRGAHAYGEYSDDVSDDDYADLLNKSLDNALRHADDAMLNIGILAGSKAGIIDMLTTHSKQFSDILVWNKNNAITLGMPSHRGLVSHICELIFCFNRKGNRAFSHPQWPIATMNNRIDTPYNSGNEYSTQHAAAFPIELPAYVIRNFTESSILDLFGGTGTTLIAAEQLDRKCYMMELDPHYCDLIIKRWEDQTHQKATIEE